MPAEEICNVLHLLEFFKWIKVRNFKLDKNTEGVKINSLEWGDITEENLVSYLRRFYALFYPHYTVVWTKEIANNARIKGYDNWFDAFFGDILVITDTKILICIDAKCTDDNNFTGSISQGSPERFGCEISKLNVELQKILLAICEYYKYEYNPNNHAYMTINVHDVDNFKIVKANSVYEHMDEMKHYFKCPNKWMICWNESHGFDTPEESKKYLQITEYYKRVQEKSEKIPCPPLKSYPGISDVLKKNIDYIGL